METITSLSKTPLPTWIVLKFIRMFRLIELENLISCNVSFETITHSRGKNFLCQMKYILKQILQKKEVDIYRKIEMFLQNPYLKTKSIFLSAMVHFIYLSGLIATLL